jgi:hypothetical protein
MIDPVSNQVTQLRHQPVGVRLHPQDQARLRGPMNFDPGPVREILPTARLAHSAPDNNEFSGQSEDRLAIAS